MTTNTTHKTHELTNEWGSNISITSIQDDGLFIKGFVWTKGKLAIGDYLILPHEDGGTTRYQIQDLNQMDDPSDMYKVYLKFAPRD